MFQDAHDLEVTAASATAVQAFDHALTGYLGYRADTPQRLAAVFDLDSELGLAHCLKGYFAMLSYKQTALPTAEAAAMDARRLTGTAGCDAGIGAGGRATLERDTAGLWRDPGSRCFAHEECGHYTEAEAAGPAAIDRDPGDLWAAHGAAHMLEMQGRRGEGVSWIDGLRGKWDAANNPRHHPWWHAAMFHLERGETDRILAMYGGEFRNLESRLTEARPDLYIDVQNAASMRLRLRRHNVDVGYAAAAQVLAF
jgi:hypothetical protein